MSTPTQTCLTCNRSRSCMRHLRAEFPPAAAKQWLKKHCMRYTQGQRVCDIHYTAGIEMRGHAEGQVPIVAQP